MGSDLVELPELQLTEDGKVVDGSVVSSRSDENTNGEREDDATPPEDREQEPAKNGADIAGDAGATEVVHDAVAATATGGDVVDNCASDDNKENGQPAAVEHVESEEGKTEEPAAGEGEGPGESVGEDDRGGGDGGVVVEECQGTEEGGGVEVTEECPGDCEEVGQDNHDDGSVVGGVRVEEEGAVPPSPTPEPAEVNNSSHDEVHSDDHEQNNQQHQEDQAIAVVAAEEHEEAPEAKEEAKEVPEEATGQ